MRGNLKRVFAFTFALAFTLSPSFGLMAHELELVAYQASTASALQRGYRTGYSDGYTSGYADAAERAAREFRNKDDYTRANRAYDAAYGALDDYRDGYQQGFESGYSAGYDHRTFDSSVPVALARRAVVATSTVTDTQGTSSGSVNSSTSSNSTNSASTSNVIGIPANTVLRVELLNNLSTEASQRGDTFDARVVEPQAYQDATVRGHITLVKRPGKMRGNAELQLSFDEIRFADNRTARFDARVVEVIPAADNGVGKVDPEGGVQGKNSRKDDVTKIGAGAGLGALIGAIAGGGGGAAVGAVIGGAVGAGGVLASRGKDIYLPRGQQLRIRTASPTRYE